MTLGVNDFHRHRFLQGLQYQKWVPSYGESLRSNWKSFFIHKSYVVIVPMNTSYLAYCSIKQSSIVGKDHWLLSVPFPAHAGCLVLFCFHYYSIWLFFQIHKSLNGKNYIVTTLYREWSGSQKAYCHPSHERKVDLGLSSQGT